MAASFAAHVRSTWIGPPASYETKGNERKAKRFLVNPRVNPPQHTHTHTHPFLKAHAFLRGRRKIHRLNGTWIWRTRPALPPRKASFTAVLELFVECDLPTSGPFHEVARKDINANAFPFMGLDLGILPRPNLFEETLINITIPPVGFLIEIL